MQCRLAQPVQSAHVPLSFALMMSSLPRIAVLATGGTIAGSATSRTDTTAYTPAAVGVDALLQAVPELTHVAQVHGEQIAQVASADMHTGLWLTLARRARDLLADAGIAGVVITHGTDTMEETAYFLHLAVASEKPIVLVGAMRPSTALSADGPANLLQAVTVATDPRARGRGTLVVMNGMVHGARDVAKANTSAVDAFISRDVGLQGVFRAGGIEWFAAPSRLHSQASVFARNVPDSLPIIEIIYCYAGMSRFAVDAAMAAHQQGKLDCIAQGLIVAGVGDGCLPKHIEAALADAAASGIAVVRSTRVATGAVTRNGQVNDDARGFVPAGSLSPQKARILLMLALAQTRDNAQLQQWFDTY
jgi:L-asparaginase